MLIGEGPGKAEDAIGRPFCGPSGKEQDNTYFRLAGLERNEVYVTNAVQCRQERNGTDVKPGEKLLQCCAANHLPAEIAACEPEIVILAGATACSLAGKIDLDFEHGRPRWFDGESDEYRRSAGVASGGVLRNWSGWLVPMYHPAAGMHDPSRYMTPLLEDWEKFGLWLRGKWEPPKPEHLKDYRLVRTWAEFKALLPKKYPTEFFPAVDTESDEGRPYSRQFAWEKGRAVFTLEADTVLQRELDRWMVDVDGLILHNAAYDLEELAIRPRAFRDTMQELYHLGGSMPQGLKAAVYRAFGFRMTSYDEVVTPHSKSELGGWLAEALAYAATEMGQTIPHPVGKDCPTCGKNHRKDVSALKPHEAEAVLRRIMAKMDEGEESAYDPWQSPAWSKGEEKPRLLGRPWLVELEQAVGRMPRKSIVHAPLDRQIEYGCSDADWTKRLAGWLVEERRRIVEHEWKVAA